MKANIEIKKTLCADNDKRFSVGDDIAFTRKDTGKRYIAQIKEIYEKCIVVDNVEYGEERIKEKMIVYYDNIVDKSCSYVYVD